MCRSIAAGLALFYATQIETSFAQTNTNKPMQEQTDKLNKKNILLNGVDIKKSLDRLEIM